MPKHPNRISVWESTPSAILDEVLHFIQIASDDTFFDLGSGDGCVLVRASKLYGCKSVGLEITPELIQRTKNKARRAGVKHLVSVRNRDMRKARYKNATIVYMYLPDGAVKKMFPVLLRQCKKGTKIVTLGSTHVSGNHEKLVPYKYMRIELPDRHWTMRMWIV